MSLAARIAQLERLVMRTARQADVIEVGKLTAAQGLREFRMERALAAGRGDDFEWAIGSVFAIITVVDNVTSAPMAGVTVVAREYQRNPATGEFDPYWITTGRQASKVTNADGKVTFEVMSDCEDTWWEDVYLGSPGYTFTALAPSPFYYNRIYPNGVDPPTHSYDAKVFSCPYPGGTVEGVVEDLYSEEAITIRMLRVP